MILTMLFRKKIFYKLEEICTDGGNFQSKRELSILWPVYVLPTNLSSTGIKTKNINNFRYLYYRSLKLGIIENNG